MKRETDGWEDSEIDQISSYSTNSKGEKRQQRNKFSRKQLLCKQTAAV